MSYNNYETSYTSYSGGGGGGGGFIPGEGGGSQTSPSGPRDYSRDNLRPVTIKQIIDAQPTGQEFKVDNANLSQITFVGQIRNIAKQTTNITYKIDDGTGAVEVKQWVDAEAPEQTYESKLIENAYCRVWGKLKSFNDRKHVSAIIIRPVEDFNEVSYHLLEATVTHLQLTRGPPGGDGDGAAGGNTGGSAQQGAGTGSYGGPLSGFTPVARKVYEYLRTTPQTNEGLHQQEIASNLHLDIGEVGRAGDELLEGGVIYTTVDDLTWAILETD
ncbi:replication protein-like protein A 32 kDa subunit [Dendryphion nanum]|uniref:Replication protein-like protein A 32 kDa subunit n=1 Tax=Dendryphion nanum TaxID=256645 RepID=A0A9P9E399_9PLEO|nr:replication protein-like protein A 32 kDa subunit [Dendryphion nanum]